MNWDTIFDLDKSTWQLIWKISPSTKIRKGTVAGYLNSDGYYRVKFRRKLNQVHRIIWEMINGPIPPGKLIDHRDTDTTNNNIDNLRLTEGKGNSFNRSISIANTSGRKGVCSVTNKAGNSYWMAYVKAGNTHNRKLFPKLSYTLDDARAWVESERLKLHGSYANHG